MKHLPDSVLLRSLVLPGTHDSNTNSLDTKFLKTFSRCQKLSVFEQLMSGVRYLDIRYCMCEEKYIKSLGLKENHLLDLLLEKKRDNSRLEKYLKVYFIKKLIEDCIKWTWNCERRSFGRDFVSN
jgi:hypothetical protein